MPAKQNKPTREPPESVKNWLDQWYEQKQFERLKQFVARAKAAGATRRQVNTYAGWMFGAAATGVAGAIYASQPAQAAATGEIGTAADPLDILYADEVGQSTDPVTAIYTEKADITGETYIEASLSGSVTGISSGSSENIVDTEDEDNLDEFDSSQEFTPTETGKYRVQAYASVSPGADQDKIRLELQESDGTLVEELDAIRASGSSGNQGLRGAVTKTLNSGTAYKVVVINNTSSWEMEADSHLEILKETVHP